MASLRRRERKDRSVYRSVLCVLNVRQTCSWLSDVLGQPLRWQSATSRRTHRDGWGGQETPRARLAPHQRQLADPSRGSADGRTASPRPRVDLDHPRTATGISTVSHLGWWPMSSATTLGPKKAESKRKSGYR